MKEEKYRIILSGGGTGGHIFPAVSIADELRNRYPDAEFLFVGAEGRMEMTRVPECGYEIEGLPIAGMQRRMDASNLLLPFKVIRSLYKACKILRRFRPHVVIGTGGYASAPVLFAASIMGIPTLIQEQNGFAGMTNKILSRRAKKICVAYEGLEDVFPAHKIILTGNPIRSSILAPLPSRSESLARFSLTQGRKTVVVLGGSLGAREVNKAVFSIVKDIVDAGYQIIWQCGKLYHDQYTASLDKLYSEHPQGEYDKHIRLCAFISDMNSAYGSADVIVSRAGASTVSELCVVGRPVILIPSPNVAENHQYHNAHALSIKGAACLIEEGETLSAQVLENIRDILTDEDKSISMSRAIKSLARPNATAHIADQVETILKQKP